MRIVKIHWRDSRIFLSELKLSEGPFDIAIIETVGILLETTSEGRLIARDFIAEEGQESSYRGLIIIPSENIISIEEFLPEKVC